MWIYLCHGSIWTKAQIILQFSSVAQSCLILCNPMDCSAPDLPVHHQLPESTQIHVHWVNDAINHLILCCPLLLPPSIFPSTRVFSNESVLCIKWPKYWSFSRSISPPMNIQDWFPLEWTGWVSLPFKGLSKVISNTIDVMEKHQFFSAQLLYSPTLTSIHDNWKNHSFE